MNEEKNKRTKMIIVGERERERERERRTKKILPTSDFSGWWYQNFVFFFRPEKCFFWIVYLILNSEFVDLHDDHSGNYSFIIII